MFALTRGRTKGPRKRLFKSSAHIRGKTRETEAGIQRAILEYLNCNNCIAWRVNSGVVRPVNTRGERGFVKLAPAGTPDIAGVMYPSGKALFVEVKRPGNKPTESQLRRMQDLAGYGALCILAYSIEDVKAGLEGAKHKMNEHFNI